MSEDSLYVGDDSTILIPSDVVNSDDKMLEDDSVQFNFKTSSYEEILRGANARWNAYRTLKDQELSILSRKRKELIPKRQWSAFVANLEGMNLKTLNLHLDAFEANGNKKADHLAKRVEIDRTGTVVNIISAKLIGDELTLKIRHYHEEHLFTNVLRIS